MPYPIPMHETGGSAQQVVLVYVTPSALHGLADDGPEPYSGPTDAELWRLMESIVAWRGDADTAVLIEVYHERSLRDRVLHEQRGHVFLLAPGQREWFIERDVVLGGLANMIIVARRACPQARHRLLILGDILESVDLDDHDASARGEARSLAAGLGLGADDT